MKVIRFIDLFGGIGGFRKGLEDANKEIGKDIFKCVWYNDIDKYATKVYNKNFNEKYEAKDIREIKESDIPEFDMLCAGFPCQAFSVAGKQGGFQDTRGTLFFEIARIVKVKKPKVILLENVKGLLNHQKGETFKVILQTLDELGYATQWMVLNSKFFGVPQNRERVFIIGYIRGESRPEILFDTKTNESSIKIYKRGKHQQDIVYETDGIMASLPAGTHASTPHLTKIRVDTVQPVLTPNRTKKRQNGRRFKENGEAAFTLTGQDIHGIMINNTLIRRLTPVECERLQSFPDNWTKYGYDKEKDREIDISNGQRYKQLGNAVTTSVIKELGKRLICVVK